MNGAHLHLIVNHFPVVTAILGLPLVLAAIVRRTAVLRNLALGVSVAAAALAVPAYFTGEPAEETVERMAGVDAVDIERHEEAARIAAILVGVQGIVALVALVTLRRRPDLPMPVATTLLVLAIAGAGLMARAANLGGMIRHGEIRSAAPAGSVP